MSDPMTDQQYIVVQHLQAAAEAAARATLAIRNGGGTPEQAL